MRSGAARMALLLLIGESRSNVKTARRRYPREGSGQLGYSIAKEVLEVTFEVRKEAKILNETVTLTK
jgi:hypothetical protein